MEPGSQSVSSPARSPNRIADVVGIAIAILTLTVPLVVIAYYSSGSEPLPPANNALHRSNR